MKNLSVIILGITLICISFSPVQSQSPFEDDEGILREVVLSPSVKTIQLYRQGWPLSYPVIRPGAEEGVPLVLEFDHLQDDGSTLLYSIIHCNADWSRSDMMENEYLEGYAENEIPGGDPSFNTYTSYLHHRLIIPNENTRLLLSGNYMLVVYRDWDPEDVVFTKRFLVTEGTVNIEGKAGMPVLQKYKGCCHEINFTVKHRGVRIDDPFNDCYASICQNGLWDMAIAPLQPTMVNPGELLYESHEENIFPGGNEFRFFDTKNTRTPTYYVRSIEFLDPYFHFELKPDLPKKSHVYLSGEDINGRYAIDSEYSRDPGVDADYVFVHFRLEMPLPLEGSVYIAGALTNWQFNDTNRMKYIQEEGAYVHALLLKQGVYNYRYLFLPAGTSRFEVEEIEGSFYETEDEYLILFYHRPPGTRYDRLIGHQVIHSNQ